MATVTVVIPTYNGSRYLPESVASVRRQGVKDVEIVVVDDASDDGGMERLKGDPAFAGVRFLRHHENRGPGESRRTGVREAGGDYVAFLDVDDLYEPELLASALAIMEQDPTIGLFCCDGLLVDVNGSSAPYDGRTFNAVNAAIKRYPLRTGVRTLEEIFLFPTIGIGFLVRRDVFERVSYPAGRRLEDYEFQLEVAASGFRVYYHHAPLARYRMHSGNASGPNAGTGMAEQQLASLQTARRKYAALRRMGWRARGRIADARMDLAILHLKVGDVWRGVLTLGRAVVEYPPQVTVLARVLWRWVPSRISRLRSQASTASDQMADLSRSIRILRSVAHDCAIAARLGRNVTTKWRLASALVGWHHAGRIPLLNGHAVSNGPLQLHAYGRRFDLWLAPDAAKNEMLVFHEIFGERVYEMPIAFEPRVIVDLGSFTGLSPLFFALRYPNAVVHCVEPDPENFAALTRNTTPFPAITRLNCAVAGSREERQFYLSSTQTCGHSLYPGDEHARSLTVSCVTVNDVIEKYRLQSIDILKFDVEGAEREVFADFPFRVPVRALVGELHFSRADEQLFARTFSDRGYEVTLIRDEFLGLTMFRAILTDLPTAGRAIAQ